MTDLVPVQQPGDHLARPTIADVLDANGNALDVCGYCTLLPTVTGWVRATQIRCPIHGEGCHFQRSGTGHGE